MVDYLVKNTNETNTLSMGWRGGESSVHKDPAFDDLDDDAIDYIETEDAQDEGRTSSMVLKEKESAYKEVSVEAPVSTVKPNEGTDKRNEGTDKYVVPTGRVNSSCW
ncbi:hypothetical protein Tco_1462559 [Tanacetum coccineum]